MAHSVSSLCGGSDLGILNAGDLTPKGDPFRSLHPPVSLLMLPSAASSGFCLLTSLSITVPHKQGRLKDKSELTKRAQLVPGAGQRRAGDKREAKLGGQDLCAVSGGGVGGQ